MSKQYPFLKKFFKIDDFDNLEEKNLIYMMRNALLVKIDKKDKFNKELLLLIKSKNWDWSKKDIDGCTVLLYAIYTQSETILDYLIESNTYDISKFDMSINEAILSANRSANFEMLDKILSYPQLNNEYKSSIVLDLLVLPLYYSDKMFLNKNAKAMDLVSIIKDKERLFTWMTHKILEADISDTNRVFFIIDNYPLPIVTKKMIIENIDIKDMPQSLFFKKLNLNELKRRDSYTKNKEMMGKWVNYQNLSQKITETLSSNNLKINKI